MSKERDSKKRIAFPIQLFAEGSASVGIPDEIHVVPTGQWDHPVYGEMAITSADVAECVKNFKDKVRLDLPITEGHDNGMNGGELPAIGWFMAHRIRECMRSGGLGPMGGSGKIVEADETYYGPVEKPRTRTTSGRPYIKSGRSANKRPIVALVERGGSVRTFHVPVADKVSVGKIVRDNIARESRLHTDESRLYLEVGATFAAHESVKHGIGEYARGDVHTNSAEGYFSIFKRGMHGIYQHCKEKHLHRYLAEFDFRYNHRVRLGYNDGERAALAIKGATGKRLTYQQPH